MDLVRYGGWNRCARFESGGVELLVTLDVGPRIIRYGYVNERNQLYENPVQRGLTGGSNYRGYGGHRLWIAPEGPLLTMQPDNEPVDIEEEQDGVRFQSHRDKNGFRKEIMVRMREGGAVSLRHRIDYRGKQSPPIAPWAITVMAPGGECLFPLAPYQSHAERVLPVQPLVLWGYTDMADQRWTWGSRVIRLRQTADGRPQKVGAQVPQGYAAYLNEGSLFFKRFPFNETATYPDLGCNFETFTRTDMLEVESLGPMTSLVHERNCEHWETWYLRREPAFPSDDASASDVLQEISRNCPLVTG